MRSIIVSLACIALALYLLHLASPSFGLVTGQATLLANPNLESFLPLWPLLALIPVSLVLALEILYRGSAPDFQGTRGIGYKRLW
jgi:hypothetical protein